MARKRIRTIEERLCRYCVNSLFSQRDSKLFSSEIFKFYGTHIEISISFLADNVDIYVTIFCLSPFDNRSLFRYFDLIFMLHTNTSGISKVVKHARNLNTF